MEVFTRYHSDGLSGTGGLYSSSAVSAIRRNLSLGLLSIVNRVITTQSTRLDHIAAQNYGDARYWWILAAASNIGWSPQVPKGTIIIVPDLKEVERLIG
jgi:hypothetical protein